MTRNNRGRNGGDRPTPDTRNSASNHTASVPLVRQFREIVRAASLPVMIVEFTALAALLFWAVGGAR